MTNIDEAIIHWGEIRRKLARGTVVTQSQSYIWGYEAALKTPDRMEPFSTVPENNWDNWFMGNDDARGDYDLKPREQL